MEDVKFFVFLRRICNSYLPIMIDSEIWVLVLMCGIGVVAFFVLWAILAKVIQRISERKHKEESDDKSATNNPTSGEIS